MTALRNIQEIVKAYNLPYISRLENPIFQSDKARSRIPRVSFNLLKTTHVNLSS